MIDKSVEQVAVRRMLKISVESQRRAAKSERHLQKQTAEKKHTPVKSSSA